MRATTQVALAVRHIGQRGAMTQTWEGTFAHVIQELAKWLAPQSMATRFDLCLARTEVEALRGLTIKGRNHEPAAELTFENLMELMTSESTTCSKCGQETNADGVCIQGC